MNDAFPINRQARDQLGGLTLMFLLGMAVNLIGLPSEVTGGAQTATTVLLSLHIFVAFALVAGSVVALLRARASSFFRLAAIGLAVIALTFVCGAITVSTGDALWSYAMSVGFIASFWIYGLLFVRTRGER
jgi:heme A synthase